ncbi:hypothetical protein FHR33_009032 [Nonomuraea dietziae]|uniref:Uncharacterized protein n=1 Tax=Nonomuraea dietziae TaxID=65515 RepID=A0A7W5VG63_9ACTN|nr:hypothetical protein [Nonomuraea dietziae]
MQEIFVMHASAALAMVSNSCRAIEPGLSEAKVVARCMSFMAVIAFRAADIASRALNSSPGAGRRRVKATCER